MNNEAYASQYLDHHVARHPRLNFVLMSRQNSVARRRFSLDRARLSRRRCRLRHRFPPADGSVLPRRRQFRLLVWREPAFSSSAVRDGVRSDAVRGRDARAGRRSAPGPSSASTNSTTRQPRATPTSSSSRRRIAPPKTGRGVKSPCPRLHAVFCTTRHPRSPTPWTRRRYEQRYRQRMHVEEADGKVLSFFTPRRTHSRHVVLRDKERLVARRHGVIASQRRENAARRSDLVRHLLDARRVRRATHDRQHVVPQALLRVARSIQHYPRQRTSHARGGEGRLAIADRAVGL